MTDSTIMTNRAALALAFEEWARRYEADPESFGDVISGETYGDDCADYLLGLLTEATS